VTFTRLCHHLRRCQELDYIAQNGRMTDELERIWKEGVVAQSSHYFSIRLEGLRKTANKSSHKSRCLSRDSNGMLVRYELKAVPLGRPPQCLASYKWRYGSYETSLCPEL
jgi:hypothetical protein